MRGLTWLWISFGLLLHAQDFRGEIVPRPTVARSRAAISWLHFRFQALTFGREGPDYFPLKSAPVQGREYMAEADIYGIEAAAHVRFELTDASGRTLQPLTFWKTADSSTDGEFVGFVTPPNQPFRVAAIGTDRQGAPFRALLRTLIQPAANGNDEPAALPPGLTSAEQGRAQQMVDSFRKEAAGRAARAAREHPGGVIALSSFAVSRIAYEPFVSSAGAPLGVRLRYSIRFDADAAVATMPHVFPVYKPSDWRGLVTMKPLQGVISPLPEMPGATSLNDVVAYGARAHYRAGVTYTFSIDMVPDYIFRGSLSGRFCVHDQKFASNPNAWNALLASSAPVSYSVSWNDIDSVAEIPAFYPQNALRANFIAAGATDCGPVPNIRF